jgi:hypothetical protein
MGCLPLDYASDYSFVLIGRAIIMALSGHSIDTRKCPLSGVKRTSGLRAFISAHYPKRTSALRLVGLQPEAERAARIANSVVLALGRFSFSLCDTSRFVRRSAIF